MSQNNQRRGMNPLSIFGLIILAPAMILAIIGTQVVASIAADQTVADLLLKLEEAGYTAFKANASGNWLVTGNITTNLDSTYDIGEPSIRWSNIYADNVVSATQTIDDLTATVLGVSTLTVDQSSSLSGTIVAASLTADRLVSTNGSSELATSISSANAAASLTDETGTGSVVFSAAPTLTGVTNMGGINGTEGDVSFTKSASTQYLGINGFNAATNAAAADVGGGHIDLRNTTTTDDVIAGTLDYLDASGHIIIRVLGVAKDDSANEGELHFMVRSSGGSIGTKWRILSDGTFQANSGESITTLGGSLTLNPTTSTIVSSDPLIIQNVSQASNPGATIDGQIRLWEATAGTDARIVGRSNGTTYTWNNDAGVTFENRPWVKTRDEAFFLQANASYKTNTINSFVAGYDAFFAAHPKLTKPALAPEAWTVGFYNSLRDGYESVEGQGVALPVIPPVADIVAGLPYPDVGSYQIPDATLNETLSALSGKQLHAGDSIVLYIDRETLDGSTVTGIHSVPESLEDALLRIKGKIQKALDLDQGTIGQRPACSLGNRGHAFLVHGGVGVADAEWICLKQANDTYAWTAR